VTKEQLISLHLKAEGLRLVAVGLGVGSESRFRSHPGPKKLPVDGGALLVEVGTASRAVEDQLKQLARMAEVVVSDREIMRGTPVFKGTRIPVDLVAGRLAQGCNSGRHYRRLSNAEPGEDRHRTTVHARVSRAWPPGLPALAEEKGPGPETLSTEYFRSKCMRFLTDECLHESLVGVAQGAVAKQPTSTISV
jgi:hypothetical protein